MNPTIVINNGTFTTKSGFSTYTTPKSVIPTMIGYSRGQGCGITSSTDNNKPLIGHEAKRQSGIVNIKNPIKNDITTIWNEMEYIWDYIFTSELCIEPDQYSILLTDQLFNPKPNRQKMTEIMFETFNIPSLCIAIESILSLYATGCESGIVYDSGENNSYVVPIYQGAIIPYLSYKMDVGGKDITMYLKSLLNEHGYQFQTPYEVEIVRDIKEKLSYLSLNYEQDMLKSTENDNDNNNIQTEYQLPDGQVITLNNELFQCTEILFQPTLIREFETKGLHQLIYKSIISADIDIRSEIRDNIIISGGTSQIRNFDQRLLNELTTLFTNTTKTTQQQQQKVNINMVQQSNMNRQYSTWMGGALLSSLSAFQSLCVTKDEYNDIGINIINRKFQ